MLNKSSEIPAITESFPANDLVLDVLTQLTGQLNHAFVTGPYAAKLPEGSEANFSSEGIAFHSTCGKSKYILSAHELKPSTSLESFLSYLDLHGKIAKSNVEDRRITLQLVVPVKYVGNTPSLLGSASMPSNRRKRKTVVGHAVSRALPNPPPSQPQPRSRYQSRWSKNASATPLQVIEYETHSFKKTICRLSQDGNTTLEQLSELETIEIAKNWLSYSKQGFPGGGYLGKGYYKYAIRAKYEGNDVALLQYIPQGSTSETNHQNLLAELDVLTQASGFAASFKERTQMTLSTTLPNISYNSDGAFIGMTTSFIPAGPLPVNSSDVSDERSLLYNTFLVVPLLPTGGFCKERRFSGNSEIGQNDEDYAGMMIDAFAHHVVEDANGEYMLADIQGIVQFDKSIILFDPQAHTKAGMSGSWDRGSEEIDKFCKEHKCNVICKQLELRDLLQPFPHRPW
ncbi:kinase-like domain-containing protein [Lentinula edodes]|uniref:kinase-like domain-containing protein n=1 Tax=Lentinula edodes TaxID=5353 RepID=UPI001E8DA4BC|nr:kinase-like domain-containing protein [Lentinula edodes]KAH7869317.1 kinase-like domain-containing protein [Lentinula edodes]